MATPARVQPTKKPPKARTLNTKQELTVVREAGESLPSSLRLKTMLIVFMVLMLLAVTGVTFFLVTRLFTRFNTAVRDDLAWKAAQTARDLAQKLDVGMAVADANMVRGELQAYATSPDLGGILVTDVAGRVLGRQGNVEIVRDAVFSGPEVQPAPGKGHVRAWSAARIEGNEVGRVAVLISTRRLEEGERLRGRILLVAGLACFAALLASVFFVNFYLGPLLRFAERTLRKLQHLTETLEHRVEDRTAALRAANAQLKQSLDKIQSMQRQLMDASRRAGMADVATTVLHNVGNVLNSVNVSANVVMDAVQQSRLNGLAKVADLLKAHEADLGRFLTADDKGRKIAGYLATLAQAGSTEREAVLKELASLQTNIDHIKVIVARQQAQAKAVIGVVERVQVAELLDDAIKLNAASYEKSGVAIERVYARLPIVRVDRHKLFQMLMNLLSNARQAVCEVQGERKVTVMLAGFGESRFVIAIEDTGCGIVPENLGKIFTYGFTTKSEGHGFGLHATACAAAEMGGSIHVESEGPGKGARFTIELPCEPPAGYTGASNTEVTSLRALGLG